jgi:septal ring factor EnvC (AmiA/AmiB activator)
MMKVRKKMARLRQEEEAFYAKNRADLAALEHRLNELIRETNALEASLRERGLS